MNKNEVEFLNALRKIGFSRSLCESVNGIRKSVFESEEDFAESTDESKYEMVRRAIATYRWANSIDAMYGVYCPELDGRTLEPEVGDIMILDKDGVEAWAHKQTETHGPGIIVTGLPEKDCERLMDWDDDYYTKMQDFIESFVNR